MWIGKQTLCILKIFKMNRRIKIVFVYNADGGLFGKMTDFAHKLLSPTTYPCQLCALTYGAFTEKRAWKDFVASLDADVVFLHRDAFPKPGESLPAVFINDAGNYRKLITADEINRCPDLPALQKLVQKKLDEYVQHHRTQL